MLSTLQFSFSVPRCCLATGERHYQSFYIDIEHPKTSIASLPVVAVSSVPTTTEYRTRTDEKTSIKIDRLRSIQQNNKFGSRYLLVYSTYCRTHPFSNKKEIQPKPQRSSCVSYSLQASFLYTVLRTPQDIVFSTQTSTRRRQQGSQHAPVPGFISHFCQVSQRILLLDVLLLLQRSSKDQPTRKATSDLPGKLHTFGRRFRVVLHRNLAYTEAPPPLEGASFWGEREVSDGQQTDTQTTQNPSKPGAVAA